MYKKALILTTALLLVISGVLLVIVAPYHIYTLTLTEGVTTKFLVMNPSPPSFYDGNEFFYSKDINKNIDESKLFELFHFSHFLLPFPLSSSLLQFIPIIKIEGSGPRLGASFFDGKKIELFSFMLEKAIKLETTTGNQKLFLLPVFNNHISRKTEADLWRDLFSKKLSLPSNVGKSFFTTLMTLKSVTYNDLVYNLFVLYNRDFIFPVNTKRISFDSKTNRGMIEIPSDNPRYRKEILFYVDRGIIYSISFKTLINDQTAESYRNKFVRELSFKDSSTDSSIDIYAHYKNIAFSGRVEQMGMLYLFSAWSHDLTNKEFVRVIIYFLEKGKSNLKYLKPFYEFAYKKFGSTFSTESDNLIESAQEKIRRKTKEELENEVKGEEQKTNPKFEGNFSSPEEKVKYLLQKAKDTKINTDENAKVLLEE